MSEQQASPTQGVGSITWLLNEYKFGDDSAVTPLWDRLAPALVAEANKRLRRSLPDSRALPEHAVTDAWLALMAELRAGKVDISDRDQLFGTLASYTVNKAAKQVRDQRAQIRNPDRELSLSTEDEHGRPLSQRLEDPRSLYDALAIEWKELFEHLAALEEPGMSPSKSSFVKMVTLRLDGCTNAEIAHQLNKSSRTVERQFKIIRDKLQATIE